MARATLPDGARIAYDEYDFTPHRETAEAVALVHGFSKNRHFGYCWIPGLASHYRVIRLDQRGQGDSSPVAPIFRMERRPVSQDLANSVMRSPSDPPTS